VHPATPNIAAITTATTRVLVRAIDVPLVTAKSGARATQKNEIHPMRLGYRCG
jgi:hypothetical protein